MRPVQGQIRFAMGLSILSSLATLGALGFLVRSVEALGPGARWPVGPMAGAFLCTALAYVLRITSFDQSHYAAFELETILRTRISQHLGRVSLGEVQRIGASALAKVMHDDVKALHVFVADSTPLYARAFAMPLATFGVLLWLDWRMALTATFVLVLGFGVAGSMMRDAKEMGRLYNEARERVSAAVVEFVQAMPVVRTFDTGAVTYGRYQRALESYRDVVVRWYRSSSFSGRFSMSVLSPLPTLVVLLWLGAVLLWRESLSFSTWFGILLVGTGMAEAMLPMMTLNHLVETTKLSVARIHQILDLPALSSTPAARRPVDASVRFEGVTFRYDEGATEALTGISFNAAPGTVTALVGPSGAGKSTVARLIPRFWDVSAGRVLVGGADVRELTADALMQQVAFVFQDTFLFSGTLADNVRLGTPDASMEAVIAAAKAAQAHDFIVALPKGYDTQAGERGVFLSGGQRQRITIARAILQERPILVLDEATAFADPENEAALVEALSALMRGKTVIMIAHRLSTIRDADQILVFDRGRLVETGRHDALAAADGVYGRLWSSYLEAQRWALGGAREAR
ncbi:MAG: ABC transporter ATP-binding protein [Labilithrix sp.]|nr:ABC transporter ATP-binding protein [Labilithrix sp.]MCW5817446.1 ABC transporter ATP-binding protein [Labilithrix sp.]